MYFLKENGYATNNLKNSINNKTIWNCTHFFVINHHLVKPLGIVVSKFNFHFLFVYISFVHRIYGHYVYSILIIISLDNFKFI